MAASMTASPELADLFDICSGNRAGSIKAAVVDLAIQQCQHRALVVASSDRITVFPGKDAPPASYDVLADRRHVKEILVVPQIAQACASIIDLYKRDPALEDWREEVNGLLDSIKIARRATRTGEWAAALDVDAWRGREKDIAHMLDQALHIAIRYLDRVLLFGMHDKAADQLNAEFLRYRKHRKVSKSNEPSFGRIMAATLLLSSLDTAYRINEFLRPLSIKWEDAMVLVVGQGESSTSGTTLSTNSMAQVLLQLSGLKLPPENLYVAPTVFEVTAGELSEENRCRARESELRRVWCQTRAKCDAGKVMFTGVPRYRPFSRTKQKDLQYLVYGERIFEQPLLERSLSGKLLDFVLETRMKFALEDPRHESSVLLDYAAEQLRLYDNKPAKVHIWVLDDEEPAQKAQDVKTIKNVKSLPLIGDAKKKTHRPVHIPWI